ncbi:MAG: hypothetical protein KIC79_08145 [Firmicutes bacterium]|nr:hypothetical protein [Bacillota bacterium]
MKRNAVGGDVTIQIIKGVVSEISILLLREFFIKESATISEAVFGDISVLGLEAVELTDTLAALIETRESAIAVARNIAKNRFFIIGLLFDRHKIWNFLQKPPFSLRIIDHS